MKHSFLPLLIGLLCWTGNQAATLTHAYDGSKNAAENGTALQAAIDAASPGDELKVQAGTYVGNFTMKEGVNVSGGWNAGFTAQTDYATILDANESGRVVNQDAAFSTLTVWSNLTIQNGNVTGTGGGVLLCANGQVKHCTISHNTATTQGGGVYCDDSNAGVVIDDCIISYNSANQGGGLRIKGVVQNSTVEQNTITDSGGGMHLQAATAINCLVRNNSAKGGAGIRAYGGVVKECTIENNTTTTSNTGGVMLQNGAAMYNSVIRNNSCGENTGGVRMTYDNSKSCTMANCLIAGNSATGTIGGVSLEGGVHYVYNNTIVNNSQSSSSNTNRCGVRLNVGAALEFADNIVWGNKANGTVQANQMEINSNYINSQTSHFNNNAIVYSSEFGTNTIVLTNTDPGFTNAASGDYTLLESSSLVDAGNNSKAQGLYDLASNARISGTTVDVGCYEYQYPVLADNYVHSDEDLQEAIDATSAGTTVYVQAGTYYGNFTMKDGVNVSGGWNEDFTSQTDYATILDAQESGRVVNQPSAFSTLTIWSNLTIQNGSLSSKQSDEGGAGVWLNKKGQVKHCKIQNNTYTYESGNCLGGGVGNNAVDAATDVLIDECIICNNRATHGGGVRIRGTIQNSEVYSNTATNNSGGAFILGGSAINTIIRNNTGKGIGGIKLQGAGEIRGCEIYDNVSTTDAVGGVNLHERAAMYNSIVRNNKSGGDSGGVRLTTDNNGNGCTLANCLIAGNEANGTIGGLAMDASGSPVTLHKVYNNAIVGNNQKSSSNANRCGMRLWVGGPLQFCNNVVWGNSANGVVQDNQICVLTSYSSQTNNFVNNAVVWNGKLSDNSTEFAAVGTIFLTEDPFKDAAHGDYMPCANSELIDSGHGGYFLGTTDLAGNPRKQGTIDRGCYEQTKYSRSVTEGRFGTICLPYGVPSGAIAGAQVYKVISFATEENAGLLLEEVNTMAAGKPYFFMANADEVTFAYIAEGDAVAAGNENGLYGTIEGETVGGADYYVLQNNLLCPVTAGDVTLAANRAYLKFSEVPDFDGAAPSPKRRVIAIQKTENTATGVYEITNSKSYKIIIDGQLMIIHDGKAYNVLGL